MRMKGVNATIFIFSAKFLIPDQYSKQENEVGHSLPACNHWLCRFVHMHTHADATIWITWTSLPKAIDHFLWKHVSNWINLLHVLQCFGRNESLESLGTAEYNRVYGWPNQLAAAYEHNCTRLYNYQTPASQF